MAIEEINIIGYRSIRDLRVKLGPVNVIVGANGCGKTNLYRSMLLIQAAASGTLARNIAEEGGMSSITWAGERHKKDPVRVTLGVTSDQYEYELSLGLPSPFPASAFSLDPEVKEEGLWFKHCSKRMRLLERKGSHIKARDSEGTQVSFALAVGTTESAFSELREPERFPVFSKIREYILSWRFYHHFRTDADSPIRQPQIGCRTPVLSSDGRDLAAALQTIIEIGDSPALNQSVSDAFPDSALNIRTGNSYFNVSLGTEELRLFEARELSDGTLKYLCLLAALLTPRPPLLMAFNEPEASLHPDLMEPLARLIAHVARKTQLWITTHSDKLATEVQKLTGASPIRLEKLDGETVIAENERES